MVSVDHYKNWHNNDVYLNTSILLFLFILPTTHHGTKFPVFSHDFIQNLKDQFVSN